MHNSIDRTRSQMSFSYNITHTHRDRKLQIKAENKPLDALKLPMLPLARGCPGIAGSNHHNLES